MGEGKHHFSVLHYFSVLLPSSNVIGVYLSNDEFIIQPHLLAQNYSFPKFTLLLSAKMRYLEIV